jgi:hypothetical protein
VDRFVSLGVGGAVVPAGSHVCAFFHDQQRRAELLDQLIAEAVRAGHKCYCILDGPHPVEEAQVAIDTFSPTVSGVVRGQAELLTTRQSYVLGGRFAARAMLDRLQQLVKVALEDEGYPAVRAVGEMTWAAEDPPGVEELWLYESEVNRLAGRYPQVLVCLYDLSRFQAETVVEVLRTHPSILIADVVLPNPWYTPPDEFSAKWHPLPG